MGTLRNPTETCEACGAEVAPDEAVRTELSMGAQLCPTPMVLHRDCYEATTQVWGEPVPTACGADPSLPETGQWMEVARRSAESSPL